MVEALRDMGFREFYMNSDPSDFIDFYLPGTFLNILPGPREAENILHQCAECAADDYGEEDSPAYAHVWIDNDGLPREFMDELSDSHCIRIGFAVRADDCDADECSDEASLYPCHKGYGKVIEFAAKAKSSLIRLMEP